MRLRSESCIAGEETTFIAGVHQVHVCSASPAIYGVTAPSMACLRRVYDNITNGDLAICRKGPGLRVPELYEPRRYGRRREDRYMVRKVVDRPERKMVCVGVS